MNLLDYAFYMSLRQFEMLPLGFVLKLGFRPSNKAVLVAISINPSKQPPAGPW
jgi:high-affinity nickel permease